MAKNILAIDFDGKFIKLLVGDKKLVKFNDIIEVDEANLTNGDITNMEAMASILGKYLKDKSIKEKEVLFSIHESDTVTRHMEVPIMDDAGIRKAVEWETNQYLPQNGANHYIDYEIVEKTESDEKKIYKLLVVAVSKFKIDKYVQLAKALNLNLKSIGVASNCVSRVFKEVSRSNKDVSSIGVIDIGNRNSSIIILENGKLFIEREIPFGLRAFQNTNTDPEIQRKFKTQFDTVLSSFSKVIQFYTTGKSEKKLDQIYLIGEGSKNSEICGLISEYFDMPVKVIHTTKEINLNINFKFTYDLVPYISAVGLLISDASKDLNLIPSNLKKKDGAALSIKKCLSVGIPIAAVFAVGTVLLVGYNIKLGSDEAKLKLKVEQGKPVLTENAKLNAQITEVKSHIDKVDSITKGKVLVGSKFVELQKYVPKDIVLDSLIYNKNLFTINGSTTNYNAINEFYANVQLAKEYKSAEMPGIGMDKNTGKYTFSMTINFADTKAVEKK